MYEFNFRDLYEINCVKVEHLGDVANIYTWEPVAILDKILNNGEHKVETCIVVKSDELEGVLKKQRETVRSIFATYDNWLQRKNNFCSRKFEIVAPGICYDNTRVSYWKNFCDMFYINSYLKLAEVLSSIRNDMGVTCDEFKDSYNDAIKNSMHKRLMEIGADVFTIESLCNDTLTSIENLGAMYWWFEPDMLKEKRIRKLKFNIMLGKYDNIFDEE